MPASAGGGLVRRWGPIAVVALLLLLPLLVFVVWLRHNDRWAPVYDLAIFEMHVRDVGTMHTPLLGLGGRLGALQNGSHPGPLAFYVLAPFYRLLGGSYWALRASMAVANGVAMVGTLVITERRAGVWGVLSVGAALALLELGYGLSVLTEPWNPHLPVLWFALFLGAVWAVADGDRRILPLAFASGSICAQIHVSYIALCGGIGLFAVVPFVRSWRMAKSERDRREQAHSGLLSGAIVVLLWLPPLIEELTHKPGNLTVLADYFTHPPEASVGLRAALSLAVARLDVVHLARDSFSQPGILRLMAGRVPDATRGAVLLALWALAAFLTPKRERQVTTLHGLVLVSLVVFVLAVSRIIGVPWTYLMFSGWAIGAAMLLATSWTVALAVFRRAQGPLPRRLAAAAVVTLIGACALRLSGTADQASSSTPTPTAQLAVIAPQTAAGMWLRMGAATGVDGIYVITSSDALGLAGGEEFGLLNELERRGFRTYLPPQYEWIVGPHRVLPEAAATARIHLTTGAFIQDAKRFPGAIEVAYADLRSDETRREYAVMRAAVTSAIRELGRGDVADRIDWDLTAATRVPGLDAFMQLTIGRMGEIGLPAAVFIEPVRAR